MRLLKFKFLAVVAWVFLSTNLAHAAEDKTYVVPRDSGLDVGGAYTSISAPSNVVLKTVLDFSTYEQRFKRFNKVTLLNSTSTTQLVYFETPTGINIPFFPDKLWAIVEFHTYLHRGCYLIEGKLIKGNLRYLNIRYVIISKRKKSVLFVELLLVPKFPVLSSYITRESRQIAQFVTKEFKVASESAKAP